MSTRPTRWIGQYNYEVEVGWGSLNFSRWVIGKEIDKITILTLVEPSNKSIACSKEDTPLSPLGSPQHVVVGWIGAPTFVSEGFGHVSRVRPWIRVKAKILHSTAVLVTGIVCVEQLEYKGLFLRRTYPCAQNWKEGGLGEQSAWFWGVDCGSKRQSIS